MKVPVVSTYCPDSLNINNEKNLRIIKNPTIVPSEQLKDGQLEFGDSGQELPSLPPWVDIERARKGQKFAQEHLFGVFYSHITALFILLAQKDAREILYYTKKSETCDKAMMRYLATMLQVKLWYQSEISHDLNCPFFTSLANVRRMHKRMGNNRVRRETGHKHNHFNQYNMTLAQFSFCLLLHHPETFGVFNGTTEEFENFLHLWAIIGHALGMKPEYNLCLGNSLSNFRMYSGKILDEIFAPGFGQVSYESEVMRKALAEGASRIVPFLNVNYILEHVVHKFLYTTPQHHQLKKTTSLRSKFCRFMEKFVLFPLLKYSWWFRHGANCYVERVIKRAAKEHYDIDDNDHMGVAKKGFY